MKNTIRRAFLFLFMLCTFIPILSIRVFGLEWDGSSSGGKGAGDPAGPNGYAIRKTGDNCLGYRFSVVDKSGNTKNGAIVDVFRNTVYGNIEYSKAYKFNAKYNKMQLINNQNNGFGTSKTTSGCYKESSMKFATSLPSPSGMVTWQNNGTNIYRILSKLSIGSINNLKNGDKVLVEPLFDVRLQSIYHSVTVTELALYGKWLLGANSNGGSSSTSESWGFISGYTNKIYPNTLYTPDGQGLWSGVGALGSRGTFYNIINKGYGVGIAYTETKPDFSPILSVNICEAWRGDKSNRSFYYGKSNGSAFGNYTYANGYPIKDDNIWFAVHFPAESQKIRVRQYVRLQGGNFTTRDIYLNSGDSNSMWFDAALTPTKVDAGRQYYMVEAKQDWIDGNGNIQKYGSVKSFYIPVRPKINRYQVSLYDITGALSSINGAKGQSGCVYAGQRIYPKYTYTSENSWTSNNDFRGSLSEWKNGEWNTANGSDLYVNNQSINQNYPYERFSNLGLYTVPDNSANTNGSNRIPFLLKSQWTADTAHTMESTWIDIPITKADVELKEIRLIDENGYYVTADKLWVNQKVTPQYVYKNNTGCKIYVEGYNSDGSPISGIYAIPAYGEIYVNGKQIKIPNRSSYKIWGGVYLEGAGIYNTNYERNGSNNAKTILYRVEHPLTIKPLKPNSLYRENTQVITSFKVDNAAPFSFTPDDNISVRFQAYKGRKQIYSAVKSGVVIPKSGDNLVYFKWMVPSGLNFADLTLKGEVIDNGKTVHTKTLNQETEKQKFSQTPDTKYEKSKPSGWTKSSMPTPYANSVRWSEWVYQNGRFIKKTYGIGLSSTSLITITPDGDSPSAEFKDGDWNIKSGYGFSLYYYPLKVSVYGSSFPSGSAITAVQRAYATFPEFNYSTVAGKYRTLQSVSGTFRFITNSAAGGEHLHFIPLWYPNGAKNYTVSCTATDFWTPAGMISARVNSNSFNISGSLFDDYYIGRK